MDDNMTLNKSNNFNCDALNKDILEQAILLKTTSEMRALKFGIVPKMDDIRQIRLIEPNWNDVRQKQITRRIFRE